MPQYWCPSCRQVYAEAGYCPYDGQRLTLPADPVSQPAQAISAQAISAADGEEAALALYKPDASIYDRLVGQTLDGRYQIERKIGEGGMGVVFAARHLVLERPLAIKVLKREVARDASTIKRFVQEAQAASRVGHPSIVDVTDFGTTPEGMTYSVMEYVDGATLSSVIKLSAPLPVERALPIAAQIAHALGAAHDKGVVHRDLKPENVFLINRDGRRDFVKIVDFGIAKVTPTDQSGQPASGPRLTRAGAVFGTPEYMAPEQAAGRSDTDGRVDIYALGTILYEMLTGKVPHKSESMVRTLAMQMLDPIVPPSQARPDLTFDPDVEAVLMKALAKKREQRYATMGELYKALEGVAKGIELAQPVSSSVNVPSTAAMALQPLPPGMVAPSEAATWKPGPAPVLDSRPPRDSAPPQTGNLSAPLAVGPVSASGNTASGDLVGSTTRRPVNEPAFVTQAPRLTFELAEGAALPPPRKRWPWLVAAVVGVGVLSAGVALLLKHVERAPLAPDASVEVVETDAGPPPPPPTDALTVLEVPRDGAPLDGARRVIREDVDAREVEHRDGGPPLLRRVDAGSGVTGVRPTGRDVSVEVITRPQGGILIIGTTYRGPDGSHIEEPRGTRATITCTLPGYEPGHVEVVFDGSVDVAVCSMKRIVRCIPGVKNPFDDCPDD